MTVTPATAANAVSYLVAAGALTAVDLQGDVWADYLNHSGLDDASPGEIADAARRCLHDWAAGGRKGRVDVERLTTAIRRTRAERIRAEEDAHGRLVPVGLDREPDVANRWIQAARRGVGTGLDRATAEQHAWAAIGRTPSPPEISMDNLVGPERARAVLAAIAARKGIPK